ncbi:class I SAM-dependent methyltransferase [Flexibacterium corallicola]|uniref:class I SAM-dependent methyltransferase n=1 Tax=Flexibacterium corallicola TaxID=3037259 RepID=UPI00286FADDD|nr:class I SAM-dependent methyltransferase [Pseudovibrio sp. M1P-2-3]
MKKSHNTQEGIQRTSNNRGFTLSNLSKTSLDFIEFASHATKPSVDMGSAFGIATTPLLKKKKSVFACDLSPEHLEILRAETPREQLPFLTTLTGSFPEDFDFEKNSIGAIHCSHLLHFLTGEEVMLGLSKFRDWLCKEGKLFLTAGTPNLVFLSDFTKEFERRKLKVDWPGEMQAHDMAQYVMQDFTELIGSDAMYNYINVFDRDILTRMLMRSGFEIEELGLYTPDVSKELHTLMGENSLIYAIAH